MKTKQIIVSLCFVGLFFLKTDIADADLGKLNIFSDILDDFQLQKLTEKDQVRKYFFDNKDNEILHILQEEGVDGASANSLIQDELISIQAIYANSFSAYPGEVSNILVCNETYQPQILEQEIDGTVYKYVLMYSTERFGLGACSKEVAKYKSLFGWIFCEDDSELYAIKIFSPPEKPAADLEKDFVSFRCKK